MNPKILETIYAKLSTLECTSIEVRELLDSAGELILEAKEVMQDDICKNL